MKAEYLSHYLTDHDVANFARHSFAKLADNFTPEQNHKLIKFLARGAMSDEWALLRDKMITLPGHTRDDPYAEEGHAEAHKLAVHLRNIPEHWVPFGHPQISLRMQAPVPIRTQCFKHKVGFVESEESRRYISGRPEIYVPENIRARPQGSIKQGSADQHPESELWRARFESHMSNMVNLYEEAIADGVCPEQARFLLPQGTEVNWVWTGSLYAFANAFNQRTDPHAQVEVQELLKEVGKIIEPLYPVSWAALTQGDY